MRSLALFVLLALAACGGEPENIQAKAENTSRMLESKANALEAEAANAVDSASAPLENEARALLDQAAGAADPAANASGNGAR